MDAAGLLYDGFATAVPLLPSGASAAIKAERIRRNASLGRKFQEAVTTALGAIENNAGITKISNRVMTIPDLLGGKFGVTEIKNVISLSLSKQLRSQLSAARSGDTAFNLIVSGRTKRVSGPLQEAIESTGGKIFIYYEDAEIFAEAIFDGSRIVNH